jgi:ABC-type branched-subunit amino acid transport system ATPase component
MSTPLLEICNIHAAYLQKEILHGVSLTVHAGEIVALLGENGAGKSTVLKVVAGLLPPSQGTIRYRGRDLNGLGITERLRLGIGYLMQGGRVFPNLTVQENFELAAAEARKAGCEPACLGDWFPLLRDRRHDRAGLLSGGQRQMLAIEVVLARRPELLLLDEPTGALTEEISLLMFSQVKHYVESRAAAALLVEHVLAASSFATHHLQLTNGAIAAQNGN